MRKSIAMSILLVLIISHGVALAAGELVQESEGFRQGRLGVADHAPHRRLPYDYRMDFADNLGDLNSVEAGFAAGILCTILLLCCLLCFCCGGGARCSLWDCLALICIWEICCDGREPTDFVLV